MRIDTYFLIAFLACWLLAIASLLGFLPLAGTLDLDLYQFYGLAAFFGWLLGNLYVYRARGALKPARRFLLAIYLLGPPGILYLLWATAAAEVQTAIPLAPIYASGVFAILFLVPVSLKSR